MIEIYENKSLYVCFVDKFFTIIFFSESRSVYLLFPKMTRRKSAFKKRSFKGNRFCKVKESDKQSVSTLSEVRTPTNSAGPSGDKVSSSSKKLSSGLLKYEKYDAESDINCNIIVDVGILSKNICKFVTCRGCGASDSISIKENVSGRIGLSSSLVLSCSECDDSIHFMTSKRPEPKKPYEVNTRMAYALRSIGKGEAAGKLLCAVMNLPPPPDRFNKINKALSISLIDVSESSMRKATEEAVEENENSHDLTIAVDGTWQKRGHTSLNGVVSISSVDTGKILDVEILTKYCQICKVRPGVDHKCKCNYVGTSGGMEVAGVQKIFERSIEARGVRYTQYLGDGDSKAYSNVSTKVKPYGECNITKLECVGHVQKRLGTRLRKLVHDMRGKRLEDGKMLSGTGRLTKNEIDNLQNYYGQAIRRNQGNLEAMKKDVWAIYFHKSSTDADPCHGLCPKDSWCKYNKSLSTGAAYSHKHSLPTAVMTKIKPIFKDLAEPALLKKCLHGRTQNPNESFNNVIWTKIPKTVFVGFEVLKLGVHDSVLSFNVGNIGKCDVLYGLGINPGKNMVSGLKSIDDQRVAKSNKLVEEMSKLARKTARAVRIRQEDHMEVQNDVEYGAGLF